MIVTEMCDLHRVVVIVLTNEPLRRYRAGADVHICDLAATWPNGSGNGLQSRVSGFDSRRRLHISFSAGVDAEKRGEALRSWEPSQVERIELGAVLGGHAAAHDLSIDG